MELIIAILVVLSSAGALYYMGKSGFKWGKKMDDDESKSK